MSSSVIWFSFTTSDHLRFPTHPVGTKVFGAVPVSAQRFKSHLQETGAVPAFDCLLPVWYNGYGVGLGLRRHGFKSPISYGAHCLTLGHSLSLSLTCVTEGCEGAREKGRPRVPLRAPGRKGGGGGEKY